jgi:RimJ/RimL family protein N-acetyltransferase
VLDCWADNDKLRAFYAALAFRLHGIFDEKDDQIAVMSCDSHFNSLQEKLKALC